MPSDDYETPESAWDLVLDSISKDLVIWEPFYCHGRAGNYLRTKGYKVIHENKDFFTYEPEHYDIIVTNPPFSKRKEIFNKLKQLDKPFAILVPTVSLNNQYFCNLFRDEEFNLVFPTKRIQFIKDGKVTNKCNFDCVWICHKILSPRRICWK